MATMTLMRRLMFAATMGLMVVVAVLGTGVHSASAQPVRVKEQHGFVKACKEMGGTPTTGGPRIVNCSFSDGYVTTCNFSTNDCTSNGPAHQKTVSNPAPGAASGGDNASVAVDQAPVANQQDSSGGDGNVMVPLE